MTHDTSPPPKRLRQLRNQARLALRGFVQGLVDNPENAELIEEKHIERRLWSEGLSLGIRLLFLIQLERSRRAPALLRSEEWATRLSPSRVLGPRARSLLEATQPPDAQLESTLRRTFEVLDELAPELSQSPRPQPLFELSWGDQAVARLVVPLLWITTKSGAAGEAITWEELPPENLGWIYEALIELEPVLTRSASVRLAHPRLELIVTEEELAALPKRAQSDKDNIRILERLPAGTFTLCAGFSRKTSGSYYTPRRLVECLLRETLAPLLESEHEQPPRTPRDILDIRLLDPAMGSGHFIVAACRSIARQLVEACRRKRASGEPLGDLGLPAGRLESSLDDDTRAFDLARWLVAKRCLHGVDENPHAVELAKLSLWLESSVAELELVPLEEHLRCGDSLLGPSLADLETTPRGGRRLDVSLITALRSMRASRHDDLGVIARIWSGAVMLGAELSDADASYIHLIDAALAGDPVRLTTEKSPTLQRMEDIGGDAVVFELDFPEVFAHPRGGFDAVLANPPWDKVLPLEREFFARYDLSVLTAPTARERRPIYQKLRAEESVRRAWDEYAAPFVRTRRFIERAYDWQVATFDETARRTGGHGDRYRYFVEKSWKCLHPDGRLGLVLPNAFYGTQGATGVRRLLLERSRLELCLGFSNALRLFEIGHGQRFCLVVAQRGGKTDRFHARFGLESTDELESPGWRQELLQLDVELLQRASPQHSCFLELRDSAEHEALDVLYRSGSIPFGEHIRRVGIELYQEMNMTVDSRRFTPTAEVLAQLGHPTTADPRLEPLSSTLAREDWLVVHEKGTFRGYDDLEKSQPRYLCGASALLEGPRAKPKARDASRHFRLAARSTIHATEQRKSVFCLLPPHVIVGNSALCEVNPGDRAIIEALALLACCNSSSFNFVAKLRLGTNLNQFLLEALPLPPMSEAARRFCAHAALRLSANHDAFAPLWRAVVGEDWREPSREPGFPVLCGGDRARVAAELDGIIAHLYGLGRAEYRTILTAVPRLSGSLDGKEHLAIFDDIAAHGLDATLDELDPYASAPLPSAESRRGRTE